jgi:ABC-2 type transport system ATP-binding protein
MCSGNPNFPWCMTVKEILYFYAKLYNLNKTKPKLDELTELFELKKIINRRYDELSTGNKQRLALAKSLLNDPEIILFDEPTIGLDPDISQKIRNIIKQIRIQKNVTILLTTHYMKEAEELCDRIAFIKEGTILEIGTAKELQNIAQKNNLEETFIELVNK